MREKLIELLDHATKVFRFDAWENTDKIADHLIANGVTVSAIPAGSTVYCLYSHKKYRAPSGKIKTSNHQIITQKSLRYSLDWGEVEVREKRANKQDVRLIGSLVFLTREEAESVLNQKKQSRRKENEYERNFDDVRPHRNRKNQNTPRKDCG